MTISIIGSGNTATVLGKMLVENNHSINEIIGRNKMAVHQLAEMLHANACTDFNKADTKSDVYIIAVKDDVVAQVSNQLKLHEKIVVHTAGSVAMNVLKNASANYGVLYPLQSLRKELNNTPAVPFLIDGNNDFTKQTIVDLAKSISKTVFITDDETRLHYHVSAIIVSNFTNHLFTLTKNYCNTNHIDFTFLLPLIEETVNRLHDHEPSAMQTGPAIRKDEATMQKHLQLLNNFPELKKVYALMSDSIQSTH